VKSLHNYRYTWTNNHRITLFKHYNLVYAVGLV